MPATHLAAHYEDLAKQGHAARLGMWVFLGSEALLFSGLFTLYAAYRHEHSRDFAAGAHLTNLPLGTIMTFVLIVSSFFMVLALFWGRGANARSSLLALVATALLGILFLGLKATEYTMHFRDGLYPGAYYSGPMSDRRGVVLFFTLYYIITGLHALHVIGGLALIGWLARRTRRGDFGEAYDTPLELGGMYWHFVDIIWLFLWPLFYLLR